MEKRDFFFCKSDCSYGSNRPQALIFFTLQPLSDGGNRNFRVMACQVSIFLLCVKSFFFSKYVLISHAVSFVKSVRSADNFDLYKEKNDINI